MEEQIDVLNEDGIFTGIIKPRSAIHKDGDWHRTVHVWLLSSKNELLVQLRSPFKDNYPNRWDISSAGHIPAGENSETGAIREVKEELGINITSKDLKYVFTVKTEDILNDKNYIDREIHDVYLVQIDFEINNLTLQKEEVTDAKWINFSDLEKDIKNHPNKYVDHQEEFEKLFNLLKNSRKEL